MHTINNAVSFLIMVMGYNVNEYTFVSVYSFCLMINIIFRKYKYLFNVNIKLKIGNINNNSFIERSVSLAIKS